ncbi:9-O-acetylesterase [Oceaniferula spumae]|uniref:9-O-acetylesterase n=1 Tax=Oceaniferula spumae TaxID=2979115 RepID=A0AAT9FLA3_9BACT
MRTIHIRKVVCITLMALCLPSHAVETLTKAKQGPKKTPTLKLAGIFGDNMVLQRETDAAIWGMAKPNAKVIIQPSWSKSAIEAMADGKGKWLTKIRTPKAGAGLAIVVKSGGAKVHLKNVLSGEVWICSGQSNMQWKMRGFGVDHFKEDVQKAKYPQIRLCDVPQIIALKGQDDVSARWKECNPNTVLNFSAVAYFFGSRLHQELNVPIGLVSTNWGGSAIEGWISPEVLQKELPSYQAQTKSYAKWMKEIGVLHARSGKKPKGLNQSSPCVLFNSMVKPLMPFTFRGVIWYQGESNVKRPVEYAKLFPAMVRDWRQHWGIGDFPFYYVQIAPFEYKVEPIPVAFLREAQMKALSEPNTGMVVTMDIGEATNIHPKEKKPVGERLALLALARDYGKKDLVDSGPIYKSSKIEGDKIRLEFDHVGGGLVAKGGELKHFTIAGEDKKFVPAKAVIDGESVIVSSDSVAKPVAVRFGWGNADLTNFYNQAGLPASSFRTDNWPIIRNSKK